MGLSRESLPDSFLRRIAAADRKVAGLPAPLSEILNNESNSHVDSVGASRTKRNKISALDGRGKERRQRKGSVEPCCRVLLVSCRHRELDDDSNIYSLKPLRDAIAASFGIDDADARIRFEYGQVITKGEQGVIVRIEAA